MYYSPIHLCGIHLTSASGKVFVDALLFYEDEFFSADFIDLEKEPEQNATKEKEVVLKTFRIPTWTEG
jgi:hypothetical protein